MHEFNQELSSFSALQHCSATNGHSSTQRFCFVELKTRISAAGRRWVMESETSLQGKMVLDDLWRKSNIPLSTQYRYTKYTRREGTYIRQHCCVGSGTEIIFTFGAQESNQFRMAGLSFGSDLITYSNEFCKPSAPNIASFAAVSSCSQNGSSSSSLLQIPEEQGLPQVAFLPWCPW